MSDGAVWAVVVATMSILLRNHVDVCLHFVWTTKERQAFLTDARERSCYRCIAHQATMLGCTVLALNGLPDHVHLLVRVPTTVTMAKIMQQVKGASSALLRDEYPELPFAWNDGYGVFAVSRSDVERVMTYIAEQKSRHAAKQLYDDWENPLLPLPSGGRSAEGP